MNTTFLLPFSIILFSGIPLLTHAQNIPEPAKDLCDETCLAEYGHESARQGYSVVSPTGNHTVEMISQAPRLNTLDGKTIALVGGSFMASITHPEIKRLIRQHYPNAHVLLFDEIGSAGVYPAPDIRRRSKDEFQQKLKEKHVDAVISGNGGCGLCTPKETGSCIAAEYIGIPAVMIAAPGFDEQAYSCACNNGIPNLRTALYPGVFATHSREELLKNTHEILWPQIIEALTNPFSDQETASKPAPDAYDPRVTVFHGDIDEINRYFTDLQWSDGLPIVPPTIDRVNEFIRFTDLPWDETVAVLPVAHRQTLVWHVAVNGVMAGCRPEYMPILIALTKAMENPSFRRTLGSTHAWIPYCWINGPVTRQLGINNGQGEISEAANASIGRFLNLAMRNLAGYYIKENRMGTFGYPMPWCLAEDETTCRRIGWEPYHVRKGYSLHENTVTASSALLWGNNLAPATTDARKIMELLAWDIAERCQFALGSGMQYTHRVILLTEEIASRLAGPYPTTEALENELIREARRPLYERAFANYYANPGSAFDPEKRTFEQYLHILKHRENAEATKTPIWHASDEPEILTIPTMRKGETEFLITGDPARNKLQTMPGGGTSTIRIELPQHWDSLVAPLGYKPIEEYYIRD